MNDTQKRATELGGKLNSLSSNIGIFAADLEKDIDTILGKVDKDVVDAQAHVNNCQKELDELQKTVSAPPLAPLPALIERTIDCYVAGQLLHVALRVGWQHRWGSHPRMRRWACVC